MLHILLILMFGHWVADFICQSNWMAVGKSKRWTPLLAHVGVYSSVLALVALCVADWRLVPLFAVVNCGLHLAVDYVTSRISSYFWSKQDTHKFFITIGFDQYLHFASIALTAKYLL